MTLTFHRAYPPSRPATTSAIWFPYYKDRILVESDTGLRARLIKQEESEFPAEMNVNNVLYVGELDGKVCMACDITAPIPLPAGQELITLWELYRRIDEDTYSVAGYALQLLHWQRTSHYCPACASPTASIPSTWGKICTQCNYERFPPVSPAVLILLHNGDKILLAHKPGWGKRYGLIAGFVEPGETLEACVRREVNEEANVEVNDIIYMGNQSWPFPHQLMVGFSARYAGGVAQADQDELDDVRWFTKEELPNLPPPSSLANQMIKIWWNLN